MKTYLANTDFLVTPVRGTRFLIRSGEPMLHMGPGLKPGVWKMRYLLTGELFWIEDWRLAKCASEVGQEVEA